MPVMMRSIFKPDWQGSQCIESPCSGLPRQSSMGKRPPNISGISRYVFHAPEESSGDAFADNSGINAAIAMTSPASKQEDVDESAKKRTYSMQSKGSKYDVVGLVPYYRTASEVPVYLQKCLSLSELRYLHLIELAF